MPIPWNTFRPAFLSLVADLTTLQTLWIDKRRPYIDPIKQAVVLLRIRDVNAVGIDDRRFTDLNVPIPQATLEDSVHGHRLIGLDIRVESFRQADERFAFNAAEELRSKLFFLSSLSRLRAQNVALVRIGQVIDIPNFIQDDRVTSVAVLDLILNVGVSASDTANPLFNIETVDNPVDHPNTVITKF